MGLPLQRISRWGRRSSLSAPSRIEVRPPSAMQSPGSLWQRLLTWMMAPAPLDAFGPPSRLDAVRAEFVATLADIDLPGTRDLRQRVQQTQSLRELWHLRSDVFRLVGLAHSEAEALRRVDALSRHFPTRAPRAAGHTP